MLLATSAAASPFLPAGFIPAPQARRVYSETSQGTSLVLRTITNKPFVNTFLPVPYTRQIYTETSLEAPALLTLNYEQLATVSLEQRPAPYRLSIYSETSQSSPLVLRNPAAATTPFLPGEFVSTPFSNRLTPDTSRSSPAMLLATTAAPVFTSLVSSAPSRLTFNEDTSLNSPIGLLATTPPPFFYSQTVSAPSTQRLTPDTSQSSPRLLLATTAAPFIPPVWSLPATNRLTPDTSQTSPLVLMVPAGTPFNGVVQPSTPNYRNNTTETSQSSPLVLLTTAPVALPIGFQAIASAPRLYMPANDTSYGTPLVLLNPLPPIPPDLVVIDTHDGTKKRDDEHKRKQEKRRQDLIEAFGPPEPETAAPIAVQPVGKYAEDAVTSDNGDDIEADDAEVFGLLRKIEDQTFSEFHDELSRILQSVRAPRPRGGGWGRNRR